MEFDLTDALTHEELMELIDAYTDLEVKKHEQGWLVLWGHQKRFYAPTQDVLDAFLYGLLVGYSVLPERIRAQLRNHMWFYKNHGA